MLEMEVAEFQGENWINASSAYYTLSPELVLETDRWDRRLKHIHIALCAPDCRTTRVGNIAELLDPASRARKDVWILKTVWDAAMQRCADEGPRQGRITSQAVSANIPPADHAPAGGDDARVEEVPVEDGAHGEGDGEESHLTLTRIALTDAERFVHDGRRYDIEAYGARTFDGLYLNACDISTAIGMRFSNMPATIKVTEALVDGDPTQGAVMARVLPLGVPQSGCASGRPRRERVGH